jgi:hypothetical protein
VWLLPYCECKYRTFFLFYKGSQRFFLKFIFIFFQNTDNQPKEVKTFFIKNKGTI